LLSNGSLLYYATFMPISLEQFCKLCKINTLFLNCAEKNQSPRKYGC